MDKCPWCNKTVNTDGKTVYVYNGERECRYCNGTGLASEWKKHSEYQRQLRDERLTKYKIDWPAGTHSA